MNGSTFIVSHDEVGNLAHFIQHAFNVWVMLWMSEEKGGGMQTSQHINVLNIDSLYRDSYHEDRPNQFFHMYARAFKGGAVLRASSFRNKVVCFERLVLPPKGQMLFTWDGWQNELPCGKIGPSSLFQRFNRQVRLVPPDDLFRKEMAAQATTTSSAAADSFYGEEEEGDVFQVLLIVRNEYKNDWGVYRTSRNFVNLQEIRETLINAFDDIDINNTTTTTYNKGTQNNNKGTQNNNGQRRRGRRSLPRLRVVEIDLAKVSFSHQLMLAAQSNVIVGAHGAGLTTSLFMSVGNKEACCGLLEIVPLGEFTKAKGFGNK